MTQTRCLVTGANGHLGNHLVRSLITKGYEVRAGVRGLSDEKPFTGIRCERVYAEMRDAKAMQKAMSGIDLLFHVAAVFRHWAPDPERDIVQANVDGTEIVLRAAAEAGVRRIVYVSSVAAVGHDGTPLNETAWNDNNQDNHYYQSKIKSERRAWALAKELNLDMVAILPSAMIGPIGARLTDTMDFVNRAYERKIPLDPWFFFNFVDVRDVVDGIVAAAEKGRSGERYILANSKSQGMEEIINAANQVSPGYRQLARAPRFLLMVLATIEELLGRLIKRPASLLPSQVRAFYGVRQEYDISKARRELGYEPRSADIALLQT
ncbi:MAG: NAD-dependent epimerase/dehydratase family protein, partial [Oceanococcus sp.]